MDQLIAWVVIGLIIFEVVAIVWLSRGRALRLPPSLREPD